MKRIKLVVAYDGTHYHGWQLQPNGLSIEAVLNQTLSELLKEPIMVIGASRTDSGVHALGNVAVFDTENRMPGDKICFALNQRLPKDIQIQSSEEVLMNWHPRKQNCTKTYEYKILNRKIDMPVNRLYTYFCYFPLDVDKMKQAAAYLVGEHDFRSFCTVRTQAEETVRTIHSLTIERGADDIVVIRISGNGFLYNMVRIIAGTLLRVGTGLYPPKRVEEILDARSRQAAGPTLPAKGLTLINLEYEKTLPPETMVSNKYWKYLLVQREIAPKKKAYVVIWRCEDGEFHRLVTRLVHQAARNGAKWIYVADSSSRIQDGQSFGYYQMNKNYCYLEMEKEITERAGEARQQNGPKDIRETKELQESQNIQETKELQKLQEIQSAVWLCPLKKEDWKNWLETYNEAFFTLPGSATYDETMIQEEEEKGSFFFWIYAEETQIGVLVLLPKKEDGMELISIDIIAIKKEFRNLGYGRKVLSCVEDFARLQGVYKLVLMVADSNQSARYLYENAGFQVVRKRPDFFCAVSNLFDENDRKRNSSLA